ncbi:MAG: hypothetical protein WBR26_01385 [Candidatus Acidiferrum sp.]
MSALTTALQPQAVPPPLSSEVRTTICAAAVAICTASFGPRLHSLILTGSLARDEATILKRGTTKTLVGDADFLVVLHQNVTDTNLSELHKIERSIEKLLFETGISAHVGLGTVNPAFFDRLQPRSFTYELKHSGEVLWGDAHILNRIPQYHPAHLSKEDAWRTLNHRTIEVLIAFAASDPNANCLPANLEYALIKLYLDLATSYLIFVGRYQPTYAARAAELRSLLKETGHLDPWLAHEGSVLQRISECTERKITGKNLAANDSSHFLEEAISYARQLWLWEALELSGSAQPLPLHALIGSLGRRQSISDRLRGWASLLRRVPRNTVPQNCPRWLILFWVATPRYLTYASAFELFCQIPQLLGSAQPPHSACSLDLVRQLLPVLPSDQPENWLSLAEATAHSYRNLLLGTSS